MTEQERREPALGGEVGNGSIDEPAAVSGGPSLGERILQAREAAGLSTADLAQPLNLDLRVIENIERDALDEVPGRPYILAYLRSWAGQIGIDPEELVEQYNRQQGAARDDVQGGTHPTLDVMERPGISWGRLFRWFVVLLVGLLVVLALLQLDGGKLKDWWPGATDPSADSPATPEGELDISRPDDESAGEPRVEDDGLAMPPTSALRSPAGSETPVLPSALPEGPLPALGGERDADAPIDQAAEEAVPSESSTAPSLVLRAVGGESWVEIRDAAGERVMYDVLAEGERRAFEGPGPFTIVLGNPAVLELEYDGQPVDLNAATDTGVLRTTVGDS